MAPSTAFDIVDALTVVGPWRDRQPGQAYDFEALLAEHERFGITRRLTLHAESRDGVPDNGNADIARQTLFRTDTGTIWTALPSRRFGGRSADAFLGDAESAGVGMVALFPEAHGHHLTPWANGDLYKAMESVRLPLVLDIGNAQAADARHRYDEVHAIASAYPRLPIILWNAFYMDERLQVPLLDVCPNVRVGLATVFIPTWGIEQYTARYGPERLIFGSNWPRQSPGPLLTYVLYADVHDRAKVAILGGNVTELLQNVRWAVRGFPKKAKTPTTSGKRRSGTEGEEPGADTSADTSQPSDATTGTDAGTDASDAPDAADAPWLEAMAALEARAPRGAQPRTDDAEAGLDPRRAPGEEGQ